MPFAASIVTNALVSWCYSQWPWHSKPIIAQPLPNMSNVPVQALQQPSSSRRWDTRSWCWRAATGQEGEFTPCALRYVGMHGHMGSHALTLTVSQQLPTLNMPTSANVPQHAFLYISVSRYWCFSCHVAPSQQWPFQEHHEVSPADHIHGFRPEEALPKRPCAYPNISSSQL